VSEFSPPPSHPPVAAPPGVRPVYPAFPPPGPRRRWPAIAAAAAAGAVAAAALTGVIAAQVATDRADSAGHTSATVTVIATPSPPPTPAPLPAAQADRQTCNAWLAAGNKVNGASAAQSVIPKGMTIVDQEVRDNPDWTAAVRKAADLYGQASDTLATGIAPGTTVILNQAAFVAVDALHTLSTAVATFDEANGNAFQTWKDSASTVNVLCERLAPR
jgi:hypothetical protein